MESLNWPLPGGGGPPLRPQQMTPISEKSSDVESLVYDRPATYSVAVSVKSVESTLVVGTTQLIKDGKIRLIPMPSADPKDPLNLPNWRKWLTVGAVCFFGALSLSAEIVISGLLPIFILEYAGVDPTTINQVDFTPKPGQPAGLNLNPLAVLPAGVAPPSLNRVALLATIPLLTNGVASYLLVPLSIAIGRRPVLLFACTCAWAGGLWAGLSTSLVQHIVARAVMGLGAGAAEALIPLIIQDMVFLHQRNRAMSAIVSSQALIIVGLGVAAPFVAANHTWRWLYLLTSGLAFLAWLLLGALLPETRWPRTPASLAGRPASSLPTGTARPALDPARFPPRTLRDDLALFTGPSQWRAAARSLLDTLRTALCPAVLWATAANSVFLAAHQAAAQLTGFALLARGWQFQWTGLAVLPFLAAAALVYAFGGPLADRLSLRVTRLYGGRREAEHHLPNLILPFVAGIAGAFVFGAAGQANLHAAVLLVGWGLMIFAFLTTMTVLNVFVVESYPLWAGPVLVNVSSLRLIVAFFLASQVTTWVADRGMLQTFALYAEAMIVLALGLPALFFWGKRLRKWTAGRAGDGDGSKTKVEVVEDVDSESECSTTRGYSTQENVSR